MSPSGIRKYVITFKLTLQLARITTTSSSDNITEKNRQYGTSILFIKYYSHVVVDCLWFSSEPPWNVNKHLSASAADPSQFWSL